MAGSSDSRPVRFGLRLPGCLSATEVADYAVDIEAAGFDTAWIPDSQFIFRDVWVTMAMVADRTSRLKVGAAVTNFETRHLSVTATSIATVEEIAPGRILVGVGSGETAVKTLGMRPTRVAGMREGLLGLRRLLAGESMSFGDQDSAERRMRIKAASGRHVPLYLAATGPRMLKLAGEIADGVIVLAGLSEELIERAIGLVREGAEQAGRDFNEIDIVLAAHTSIADDAIEAVRQVKPMVVQTAQHGSGEALRAIGIDLEPPPAMKDVYPSLAHAEDWQAAVDHSSQWVTDDMAERYAGKFALVGTPDEVSERLSKAVSLGVSSFYILALASYELPHELVAQMGQIMPALR